jgi:hypothetical protein
LLAIGGNLPDILSIPVDLRAMTSTLTTTMLEGLKAE